jgi:hypothetical protein
MSRLNDKVYRKKGIWQWCDYIVSTSFKKNGGKETWLVMLQLTIKKYKNISHFCYFYSMPLFVDQRNNHTVSSSI